MRNDMEQDTPREAESREGEDREAAAPPPDADAPPAELPRAQDEIQALRDRHLRLAAEFDNYRKRVERERGESRARAQAELVERLLDPLDDLQRIAHFDPEKTSAASLLEGAQLVERKFLRVLDAAGLEVLDAAGQPFDPEVHEALTTVPTENAEEDNAVADVFQTGYRFKGALLRPARVRVRKFQG